MIHILAKAVTYFFVFDGIIAERWLKFFKTGEFWVELCWISDNISNHGKDLISFFISVLWGRTEHVCVEPVGTASADDWASPLGLHFCRKPPSHDRTESGEEYSELEVMKTIKLLPSENTNPLKYSAPEDLKWRESISLCARSNWDKEFCSILVSLVQQWDD